MHRKPLVPIISLAFLSLLISSGCTKNPGTETVAYKTITSLSVPDSFSYKTTDLVTVSADLGSQFPNISVGVYASENEESTTSYDIQVGQVTTDSNGSFSAALSVPLNCSYLVLKPEYIGLPQELRTTIQGTSARFILDTAPVSRAIDTIYPQTREITPYKKGDYTFIDTFSSYGKPTHISKTVLEASFLADINASLPEYKKVPESNPQYLEDGKEATLKIVKTADVWVTFVHEGAGFSNALGYYTYQTANAPVTSVPKENIRIIIPNASLGGANYLSSGDTFYIGRFEPGTSIGWVLFANGWNASSGTVKVNQGVYYSDSQLNPEAAADKKQHTVVLYDADREVMVTGIEDLNRTTGGDNDFNDLIFYALVNPVEAVGNIGNFTEIKRAIDTDGDGVIDGDDDFPNDPRYTTIENSKGTIAYEDMWPSLGDYDFNDLVIGYSYDIYGNAYNNIAKIDMDFTVLASGAGFRDGLALFLPLKINQFNLSPSDTFLVQDNERGANIEIFPDAKRVVNVNDMFNTKIDGMIVNPETVSLSLEFPTAIPRQSLGATPYDVFALANNSNEANKEIHLPDYAPTPMMAEGLIGTDADDSNPENGRYYKNKNNLPWAIHIPGDWMYPLERNTIVDGYAMFGAWAESNGTDYADWYQDKPKYLNKDKLFIR